MALGDAQYSSQIPQNAYCAQTDLMLEGINGKSNTISNLDKYIVSAAEEIDIALGRIYVTPLEIPDIPANRSSRLFLKRMNAHLASGRIVLASAITSESDNLNAYGASLVNSVNRALKEIIEGNATLPGAILIPSQENSRIVQANIDPVSPVDSFYQVINGTNGIAASRRTRFGEVERFPL